MFFGREDTFWGNKNKLRKNKSRLEPFFDSTSFFKDLFFKAGDLPSETVSPAAPEADLYPNRQAPLKEPNRQLKQDLQATEEELTLYKRKAASWKCVHVKKAKTATHAHATKEDSSDSVTFSDLKRYEDGSLFQGFHNGVKYDFAEFVSNRLNSEVFSCHLDNRAICLPCVLSHQWLFSFRYIKMKDR